MRSKIYAATLLTGLLVPTSHAFAQDEVRHEFNVQGTGLFTKDSEGNGITQHSTNSGGLLVGYRFHFNRWLAADASYGYGRNTLQSFTPAGPFDVQSNIHQATGAFVLTLPSPTAPPGSTREEVTAMNYLVLSGRVLYALIFVAASFGHFSKGTIDYAASQGVPLAPVAVPLSGVVMLLGGLSVALGYRARWGAWLLALFLVPATVIFHNFWAVKDPTMALMQQVMFLKN